MSFYQFNTFQKIPASIQAVWDFISSPKNLLKITPISMDFEITNETGSGALFPGMIITYKVTPIWGMRMNWMTEITHVSPLNYFVDEQRVGPYKMWHHLHRIEEIDGGVLMSDTVTYQPPFGILGTIANTLVIKKQLKEIFDYREKAIENIFGKFESKENNRENTFTIKKNREFHHQSELKFPAVFLIAL